MILSVAHGWAQLLASETTNLGDRREAGSERLKVQVQEFMLSTTQAQVRPILTKPILFWVIPRKKFSQNLFWECAAKVHEVVNIFADPKKMYFSLAVISFTIMVYLTTNPQHSGLRIPLVSICVFDRNWKDVIIARKNAGETDCPKCHRCSGQWRTILRASPWPRWGYSTTAWQVAVKHKWPERKGKQTPQARPTAAKGSPPLQAEVMQV